MSAITGVDCTLTKEEEKTDKYAELVGELMTVQTREATWRIILLWFVIWSFENHFPQNKQVPFSQTLKAGLGYENIPESEIASNNSHPQEDFVVKGKRNQK